MTSFMADPKEKKKGKALSKHHLVPGVLTTWGHWGPHQSSLTRQTSLRGPHALVWWRLWNFVMNQVKLDRFLHQNVHPQIIFWYLVRQHSWELSKTGHIFAKEFFFKMNEIKNAVNKSFQEDFWPWKLPLIIENAHFLTALN